MSSQVFSWLIAACIFLVLIFIVGRKSVVPPAKLNLRKGINPKTGLVVQDDELIEEKSLNIMFMYNGHSFDAHEVLGCPAGANLEMVERYYNQALARKGSDRDFLEAAFSAIKMKA